MSKSFQYRILSLSFIIGFLGVMQYLVVTTLLMGMYPGGNLADKRSVGYEFFFNFLSDLGRTSAFGVGPNPTAPYYMWTLAIAGVATIVFFAALGHYLFYASRNYWAIPCAMMSIAAGVGYIGVAVYPINVDYHAHITYVQIGFIGFWIMSIFAAIAIRNSPIFPNKYAKVIYIFLAVLGVQIIIMMFGPRSWTNPQALFLQVTAQKIVVYSEIITMMILNVAAYRVLRREGIVWEN